MGKREAATFLRWRRAISTIASQSSIMACASCAFSRLLPASRCSSAAARLPSRPLEERVRERRPLRSKIQRDRLEVDAAGSDLWTVIARNSRGLLSPALSSKGGEGGSTRAPRRAAMHIGTLKGCVRKAPLGASCLSPRGSNPKVEGRKKAETRSPKPESPATSGFGTRPSFGSRTSDFGLRTSKLARHTNSLPRVARDRRQISARRQTRQYAWAD